MMAGLYVRRRADEFAELLERAPAAGGSVPDRLAEDLELVRELQSVPTVEPRPEFSHRLRADLMAEAASVLTPTAAKLTVRPRHTSRERKVALAIGGFAVVSASVSMGAAAQTALPGETLYPLKRMIENAETQLRFDQAERATVLLDQAATRLVEARTVASDRRPDAVATAKALHGFSEQAQTAAELILDNYEQTGADGPVRMLGGFTTESRADLRALQSAVPSGARAALIEATRVVDQIEQQVHYACPDCGAGVVPMAALTGDLLSGPALVVPPPDSANEPERKPRAKAPAPEPLVKTPAARQPAPQPEAQPEGPAPAKEVQRTVKDTTNSVTDLTKSVTGTGDALIDGLSSTLSQLGETTGSLLGQ